MAFKTIAWLEKNAQLFFSNTHKIEKYDKKRV